jgi:hypothetical protein
MSHSGTDYLNPAARCTIKAFSPKEAARCRECLIPIDPESYDTVVKTASWSLQ